MKKIAMFLPNLKGGGAEKVAVLLANEFINRSYTVDIVLLSAEGEFLIELNSKVNVVDLKADGVIKAFKPLLAYLLKNKPDCLLAYMWPLTVLSIVTFKMANLPGSVITSDHTTFSKSTLFHNSLKRNFLKKSISVFYPLADARLAVSRGAARDLERIGNLKENSIKSIYNPISNNFEVFNIEQAQAAWKHFEGKKIIAVGSLKWEKNYPLLLNAFAKVIKQEEVMLTILGQGDLLPDLLSLTQKLGIEKHVQFIGYSDKALAWIESADLLVHSSILEGFGNVLVEALSVGTPVVSTDCKYGPREILADGKYGDLVPINNDDALAKGIITALHKNYDKTLLRLRASEFSVKRIAEQYLEVMFAK